MSDVVKIGTFDRLIATHEAGALNHELSDAIRKAIEEVESQYEDFRGAPAATIGVEFKIIRDESSLSVVATVKKKMPVRPRGRRLYWATADNQLTQTDPRQLSMELRDVSSPAASVKTV